MSIVVKNTGRFGYWLTLSDGSTVELSPRVEPISLPDREEKVNRLLKKMLDKGLVRKMEIKKAASKKVKTRPPAKTSRSKSRSTVKPKTR